MTIVDELLKRHGLEQYADLFADSGVNDEILLTMSEADLKDIGVTVFGHRRMLAQAILAISATAPTDLTQADRELLRETVVSLGLATFSDALVGRAERCGGINLTIEDCTAAGLPTSDAQKFVEYLNPLANWPPLVALPLQELLDTSSKSRLRLWSACDLAEMLLRLVSYISLAEIVASTPEQHLPQDIVKKIYNVIHEPTLGAWRVIAEAVSTKAMSLTAPLFPEFSSLLGTLNDLLGKRGDSEDISLNALRNAFAHGGGVTEGRARVLMDTWLPRLTKLVGQAAFLSQLEILVRNPDGRVFRLRGVAGTATVLDAPPSGMPEHAGQVAFSRNGRLIPGEPLVTFDPPQLQADTPIETDPVLHAYLRRGPVRIHLTAIGSEVALQSPGSANLTQAFDALFDQSILAEQSGKQKVMVQDFIHDLRKLAVRVVGRDEERNMLRQAAISKDQGVLWISGPAGVGKSALMAVLACDLLNEAEKRERQGIAPHWLVLPYRFRSDDARCRSSSIATFLRERLQDWSGLATQEEKDSKSHKKVDAQQEYSDDKLVEILLNRVAPCRVILVMDGLDEIDRVDQYFVTGLLPRLRASGVLLICSGRPEPRLVKAMTLLGANEPLSGGVKPMSLVDIRAMLFSRTDKAARRFIESDQESESIVHNKFIEQVELRAKGLPIYVECVINDILANRYRLLDVGDAQTLPKSLEDYFDKLTVSTDDAAAFRPLIVSTLALSMEPLPIATLITFLKRQGIETDSSTESKIAESLNSLGGMIVSCFTPEQSPGFKLYHDELRTYLRKAPKHSITIKTMQRAFLEGGLAPGNDAATSYFYRNGIQHLIEAGRGIEARGLLADFDYLMGRLMALSDSDPLSVNDITRDWLAVVRAVGRGEGQEALTEAFWRERAHVFRRGNADWPAYKILLQNAIEFGDNSLLSQKADQWVTSGRCDWVWLRALGRPVVASVSGCISAYEESGRVSGFMPYYDGHILCWTDRDIRIMDPITWKEAGIIQGHTGRIRGCKCLLNGTVVSWTANGIICLWHRDSQHSILFDAKQVHEYLDGTIIAIPKEGRQLVVFDATTGQHIKDLFGHNTSIVGFVSLADGGFVTWDETLEIRIWNNTDESSTVAGVSFELKGILTFSGSKFGCIELTTKDMLSWLHNDRLVRVWDRTTGHQIFAIELDGVWSCVQLSDTIVVAIHTNSISFINLTNRDKITKKASDRGTVTIAQIDQNVVASYVLNFWDFDDMPYDDLYFNNTIILWRVETGEQICCLHGHQNVIRGVRKLSDTTILSWSDDRTVKIWGYDGTHIRTLVGHGAAISTAFPFGYEKILSLSDNMEFRLWDASNKFFEEQPVQLEGAELMPNGNVLSFSYDGTLFIYDGRTHELSSVMMGHANRFSGHMVLTNGNIITWSRDHTCRYWCAKTGTELAKLAEPPTRIELSLVSGMSSEEADDECFNDGWQTLEMSHSEGLCDYYSYNALGSTHVVNLPKSGLAVIKSSYDDFCYVNYLETKLWDLAEIRCLLSVGYVFREEMEEERCDLVNDTIQAWDKSTNINDARQFCEIVRNSGDYEVIHGTLKIKQQPGKRPEWLWWHGLSTLQAVFISTTGESIVLDRGAGLKWITKELT